jgi:hypothetical protein
MLQCLCNGYSFLGIEHQQFLEQVNSIRVGEGEQFIEVFSILLVLGQVFDELNALAWNMLHVFKVRNP